jgi:hypothetical protein
MAVAAVGLGRPGRPDCAAAASDTTVPDARMTGESNALAKTSLVNLCAHLWPPYEFVI